MVAALLYLHKSALSSFKPGYQVFVIIVIGEDVADNAFFGNRASGIFFDLCLFAVAQNQIDLGHGRKFCRSNLRRAARNDNSGFRIAFAEFANSLAALAFRFSGYGAGIDNDDIVKRSQFFF